MKFQKFIDEMVIERKKYGGWRSEGWNDVLGDDCLIAVMKDGTEYRLIKKWNSYEPLVDLDGVEFEEKKERLDIGWGYDEYRDVFVLKFPKKLKDYASEDAKTFKIKGLDDFKREVPDLLRKGIEYIRCSQSDIFLTTKSGEEYEYNRCSNTSHVLIPFSILFGHHVQKEGDVRLTGAEDFSFKDPDGCCKNDSYWIGEAKKILDNEWKDAKPFAANI